MQYLCGVVIIIGRTRNPGRFHGGTLKFNLLGVFTSPEGGDSRSLSVPGKSLPSNFIVINEKSPIIRRADLSGVTLQCAIVVSI